MRNIRVGVIGFGKWAENHARFYVEEGAELVAISAPSDESRKRAYQIFGVETYKDYRDLLSRNDIDAISVVVPNYLHARVTIDALKSGKHVLVEKPMALSTSDCQEMIAAAKENGLKLAVGHELRFSPMMRKIKNFIDDGSLGNVRSCAIMMWRPPWRAGSRRWRLKKETSGGLLFEEPVHYVDLILWYIGMPSEVFAVANSATGIFNFEDNLFALMKHENEALSLLSFSMAGFGYHVTIEITGTEGSLRAYIEGGHFLWSPKAKESRLFFKARESKVQEIPLPTGLGELWDLREEIRCWLKCLVEDKRPLFTGEMGMKVIRVCESIDNSIKEGKARKLRS